MSESIPPEYIELAKSRDERIRAAILGVEIEAAQQHGSVFRVVLDAMAREQKNAIEELVACSPGDIPAISALQAQIRAYILVRDCLQSVLEHGRRQEQSLKEEALSFVGHERDY